VRALPILCSLYLAASTRPARASDDAERRTVLEGGTVVEVFHARVTASVVAMKLGKTYRFSVQHPDGRFGAARFQSQRGGFGGGVLCGLGVRLSRRVAVGVQLDYARIHAPLRHEALPAIGVRFDPWVTAWSLGAFFEWRGLTGFHGGVSLGFARVLESLSQPEERTFTDGIYALRPYAGKDWSIGGDSRLRLGLHVGVVDGNPLWPLAIAFDSPFFGTAVRALDASVAAGIAFR
jgi:hypothetical protein